MEATLLDIKITKSRKLFPLQSFQVCDCGNSVKPQTLLNNLLDHAQSTLKNTKNKALYSKLLNKEKAKLQEEKAARVKALVTKMDQNKNSNESYASKRLMLKNLCNFICIFGTHALLATNFK